MAITRPQGRLAVVLNAGRTFIQHKSDDWKEALARRRIYRATCHELSSLTDRELSDLGIPRSNIKHLALEAAYG